MRCYIIQLFCSLEQISAQEMYWFLKVGQLKGKYFPIYILIILNSLLVI